MVGLGLLDMGIGDIDSIAVGAATLAVVWDIELLINGRDEVSTSEVPNVAILVDLEFDCGKIDPMAEAVESLIVSV